VENYDDLAQGADCILDVIFLSRRPQLKEPTHNLSYRVLKHVDFVQTDHLQKSELGVHATEHIRNR